MRNMMATLFASYSINFLTNANRVIYYFKRIPFIGKLVSDKIYGEGGMKLAAMVIITVMTVLKRFIMKAAYVGLMVILPLHFLLDKAPQHLQIEGFVNLFFFLSFIAGTIQISGLLQTNQNKYVCIKLMRFHSRDFVISNMVSIHITNFIYFLPAVSWGYLYVGGTLGGATLLMVLLTAFRLINEWAQLLIFHKLGFLIAKKYWFQWAIIVPACLMAYLPIQFQWVLPLKSILFSVHGVAVLLIGAFFSLLYILKYKNFKRDVEASVSLDEIMLDPQKYKANIRFKDVEMKEKDFSKETLKNKKFEQKEGYEYLNAIFFDRHRKLLEKPIALRLCIIGAIFLALAVATFFVPEITNDMGKQLTQMLPSVVFIMYFASIGDRICRAMFFNCDISLLRYGFYRNRNVILKNFRVRLRKIVSLNMIMAIAICVAMVLLLLISGEKIAFLDITLFTVSVCCLAIFFSVHHLFLYYVCQPYTTELGLKNPFFTIINMVVYMLCFACLQLKNVPGFFTVAVIVATLLYIVIALVLVYKLAPKNFKVK